MFLDEEDRITVIVMDAENITIKLRKHQSLSLLLSIKAFINKRIHSRTRLIAFYGQHPKGLKSYLRPILKSLGFKVRTIKLRPPYYAEQIDHEVLSFLHRLARKRHKEIVDVVLIASDNDYANALAEMVRRSWLNNVGRIIVISRENSTKLKKWSSEFWMITIKYGGSMKNIVSIDDEDLKVFTVNNNVVAFQRLK